MDAVIASLRSLCNQDLDSAHNVLIALNRLKAAVADDATVPTEENRQRDPLIEELQRLQAGRSEASEPSVGVPENDLNINQDNSDDEESQDVPDPYQSGRSSPSENLPVLNLVRLRRRVFLKDDDIERLDQLLDDISRVSREANNIRNRLSRLMNKIHDWVDHANPQ